MILTIGSWFNEPGFDLKISYKVLKLVRQSLTDEVMMPFGLEQKEPKAFLRLVVTTSSGTDKIEVKGPEYDKRNNVISYGLWLPHRIIADAQDYLFEYIICLFDSLVLLFKIYDVPETAIRKVQKNVLKEVLGNVDYVYNE